MAIDKNYPIDLPILVIEAQIFVAVNKFQFLPNKLIPSVECVDGPWEIISTTKQMIESIKRRPLDTCWFWLRFA